VIYSSDGKAEFSAAIKGTLCNFYPLGVANLFKTITKAKIDEHSE